MKYIKLAEAHCRNCLRCIRECPTKAVAYVNHRITIVDNECILCGNCYKVCPATGIKLMRTRDMVQGWIKYGEKVVLSVASSVLTSWPDFDAFRQACLDAGFYEVEEATVGAEYVSAKYNQLIEKQEMENIITTTCPAVVALIQKEYPELVKYLAPVESVMIAHAKDLKRRYPDAKVVHLSTCVSSQKLADEYRDVLAATLNVREMLKWIPANCEKTPAVEEATKSITRLYAVESGIFQTLNTSDHYRYVSIDGIHRVKECLSDLQSGRLNGYVLDLNACDGGCLSGPSVSHCDHNEWLARSVIYRTADRTQVIGTDEPCVDINVEWKATPTFHSRYAEFQIQDVLTMMGKTVKSLELDCGACGYETCRQKAIAVLDGKADVALCMPYALAQAQSISNTIIKNSPNGVIVVDKNNMISDINPAALYHLHLDQINPVGMDVTAILQNEEFINIISNPTEEDSTQYFRGYYPDLGKTFDHAVMRMKEENYYVIILMDLTVQETKEKVLRDMRASTIEITQQVIDEQMRTVQEIASLLGETTAKSKVALTKLKKAMENEQ